MSITVWEDALFRALDVYYESYMCSIKGVSWGVIRWTNKE